MHSNTPSPRPEWHAWLLALIVAAVGVGVLVAALTGVIGRTGSAAPVVLPPPVPAVAVTPAPAPALAAGAAAAAARQSGSAGPGRARDGARGKRRTRRAAGAKRSGRHTGIVARPSRVQQTRDLARFIDPTATHISTSWMGGFYPIYAAAQRTFGVNWLLIASIHKQETAFSTAPTHLPRAELRRLLRRADAVQRHQRPGRPPGRTGRRLLRYGARPAAYDHTHHDATRRSTTTSTRSWPPRGCSSADGAGLTLDGSAWNAAYDYYGHDADRRHLRRPGAGAGDRLVADRLLHQLRRSTRRWSRPCTPPTARRRSPR